MVPRSSRVPRWETAACPNPAHGDGTGHPTLLAGLAPRHPRPVLADPAGLAADPRPAVAHPSPALADPARRSPGSPDSPPIPVWRTISTEEQAFLPVLPTRRE